MVLTKKDGCYIIVLGTLVSVLPISATLLQDSYQVHFKQKQQIIVKRNKLNIVDLVEMNMPNQSISFRTAFPMPFPIPIHVPFTYQFRCVPGLFSRPIPTSTIAAHCFKKASFGSGRVKQSASITAVGK